MKRRYKPYSTGRLLDLAVAIQQVPAPTFRERRRALFVRDVFLAEDLEDVRTDRFQNVYARLPGKSTGRPLIVSAHLDTVFAGRSIPIERSSGRISGPGIGDNSLGVAALIGLVWMLRRSRPDLEADLWLVANSCEEGLGDLRGMKQVVRSFGSDTRGYVILEGTVLGQVYHRAIGVHRCRVTVTTSGGHAWSDYGQPSAVHEIASMVARLTGIQLPLSPRTTMNVGTISGGTGINVVASSAHFELDLRSESASVLSTVVQQIEGLVSASRRDGVQVDMETVGRRPAGEIPAEHPLVRLAAEVLTDEGITPTLTSGSTDANVPLSMGIPAVVLGLTTGSGAHTPQEYIDTQPVTVGMRQVANLVTRLLEPR